MVLIVSQLYSTTEKIYLLYDAVHLIKNVSNNLLNRKKFLFPPFESIGFKDEQRHYGSIFRKNKKFVVCSN